MTLRRVGIYTAGLVFAVAMFSAGLLACELALRAIDGFSLTSTRLVERPGWEPVSRAARAHAARIPTADGMKLEWFDSTPSTLPRRRDSELVTIDQRFQHIGVELFHVYNDRFLIARLCNDFFKKFPGFFFVHDAPNGDEYPRYRFPLNKVSPYGLPTNQYGWRGPSIPFRKPEKTIRIAFVGASTTVNHHDFPFSYPELAGFWLDKWAQENLGVRVEAINAGREGTNSLDFVGVVRHELLPMEPDFVVYYEGANQFAPQSVVRLAGDVPSPPSIPFPSDVTPTHGIGAYSAFARRIMQFARSGRWSGQQPEPTKPDFEFAWPRDVDEYDPPLEHPNLPVNLSQILGDMDKIRTMLAESGATLVPSSYFWLVYDGMKLDPAEHAVQYWYINVQWWPYRYRDMERLAAFQNRAFKKYASVHGLPFLDIAGTMPRDHNLFSDAVHATYEGVKLHAWIVAQNLAPLVREKVTSGLLPRPFQSILTAHPAFPANERTVLFDCTPDFTTTTTVGRFDFSTGVEAVPPATVDVGSVLHVRIPANTPRFHYSARVPMPFREQPPRGGITLSAQIKVSGGDVGIGFLSADQKRFLAYQIVEETEGFVPLTVAFNTTDDLGLLGFLVIGAGTIRPHEVTVELRDARLMTGSIGSIRTYSKGLAMPP